MEKAIKYNDILTDSIILQNIVDETNIIAQLKNEGHNIKKEDARFLSPYLTGHIKRYGDYIVDMSRVPKDITVSRSLLLWLMGGSSTYPGLYRRTSSGYAKINLEKNLNCMGLFF